MRPPGPTMVQFVRDSLPNGLAPSRLALQPLLLTRTKERIIAEMGGPLGGRRFDHGERGPGDGSRELRPLVILLSHFGN